MFAILSWCFSEQHDKMCQMPNSTTNMTIKNKIKFKKIVL